MILHHNTVLPNNITLILNIQLLLHHYKFTSNILCESDHLQTVESIPWDIYNCTFVMQSMIVMSNNNYLCNFIQYVFHILLKKS